MIKKLDILIIRSFIGPFIVTFFVSLFVLVMQFFWLYMDELIGKGLGIWMILQLLFYMSATLVPLALPLGILLASIMTFGNMGENFELVAIKSSGISLFRFLRPLFIVILCIGGFAFFFNNNLIPVANLKALSLLYDLRNSKPTLNIRAGQFNKDIEGYSIRVGEKDKDGHTIRNVMVYDQTAGYGNDKVVLAKEGDMLSGANKQYLIFRLKDGWRYEEGVSRGGVQNLQQTRMYFKSWDKVFDLSSFKLNRTSEDLFKGAYQMMNVRQLNREMDSIEKDDGRMGERMSNYLFPYLSFGIDRKKEEVIRGKLKSPNYVAKAYKQSFINNIPDSSRAEVVQLALTNLRNAKGMIDISTSDKYLKNENYQKFNIEWHRKFTLSFACVLLFLIGAPLGAIIRKGGLGMPMIIAIALFIIFHIISITGEKLAKADTLKPLYGMWMATAMLLPIAFILLNAARKDSQIFTKEWYLRLWNNGRKFVIRKK